MSFFIVFQIIGLILQFRSSLVIWHQLKLAKFTITFIIHNFEKKKRTNFQPLRGHSECGEKKWPSFLNDKNSFLQHFSVGSFLSGKFLISTYYLYHVLHILVWNGYTYPMYFICWYGMDIHTLCILYVGTEYTCPIQLSKSATTELENSLTRMASDRFWSSSGSGHLYWECGL